MKFCITFKDPDGPYECIRDAAKESLPEGLDEAEKDALIESRHEKLANFCRRWLEFSEYVTLEFDTEAKTCVVVENKR